MDSLTYSGLYGSVTTTSGFNNYLGIVKDSSYTLKVDNPIVYTWGSSITEDQKEEPYRLFKRNKLLKINQL